MGGLESLQEQWLCNGLCSGRVFESQTGTVGGEGTKKYNRFTHRLHEGVEHRQMHSRAPAPKQERRVKKKKSNTVTLKKI